ncbi:MAG: NADH-quinone oxidoreductase subunit J [Deltaproteobacteria bacterium]|nr:NADH-quinone oxidoreductase subunit J [Deltaproteobacteria bacterium]
MTASLLLGYFFVGVCVIAAIYAAVSRDLFRVSIAFFVELSSVGGVLLSMNADYLALVVFAVGLMGTILVLSFSSIIMGSLKESFRADVEQSGRSRLTRAFGMILGIGVGVAIGWAFVTAPFLDSKKEAVAAKAVDVQVLGRMMLGDQIAVFELLGVMILLVVVGAGLLLRKPNDAS